MKSGKKRIVLLNYSSSERHGYKFMKDKIYWRIDSYR